MKKEDIIKCLQEATYKNVTEKGVEWKLLYEDGADAILKLAPQPNVIKSVCSFYMAGMDTSGRCNNCGKNKWEH